ncbi:DoxX family protein [Mesorhizobium sp. B2-4-10]|uniref:DoxX family protein n=1 Tax=Mesorhizobium sp. B2-4-10 TaxID=2589939 RepID=UPI00112A1697|nr:DoxX family protein [Mesorhizobium sp. B2-4-10]TPL23970.1 DoxX family protein [Mesorhizobium sp. B2-4-10]
MLADLPAALLVLGRLLLGGGFVFAGLRNIQNAGFLTGLMVARGVPQARLALWAGIVLQIVAGVLVVTGFWTATACAVLVLFLIVATPLFHNFWDHQGQERASRINGFVGNVALSGGFLTLIAQSL